MRTAGQITKPQRPQGNPRQAEDFVPDPGEQPTDFAVSPFLQHNLQVGTLLQSTLDSHVRDFGESVGKVDASLQLAKDGGFRRPSDPHPINLLDPITWMCQLVGKFTIVREQYQSIARLVESADREKPFVAGNQVDGPRPPTWIVVCAQDAGRFVKQVVNAPRSRKSRSIDPNPLRHRIDARAEFLNDLAIDFDAAFEDQLLALAPAPDTSRCKDLLQSFNTGLLVL
jgi:hypothetical protein